MATVIIPCAGNGSRLDLPFSKELLPLVDGRIALTSVIDSALENRDVRRVVVVIREGKGDIVDHLGQYANSGKIVVVHQHSVAEDAAGAALAALHLADDRCALLLPDHIIEPLPRQDFLRDLFSALDTSPVSFLVAPIDRVSWAEHAGAVRTSAATSTGGARVVTAFAEHPHDSTSYDSVWAAAGFQGSAAEAALRTMAEAKVSPQGQPSRAVLEKSGILGAAAIAIESFLDIGEWARYREHWRR